MFTLLAMATWQKIAIGFGAFILLFGQGDKGKEEVNIAVERMKEYD